MRAKDSMSIFARGPKDLQDMPREDRGASSAAARHGGSLPSPLPDRRGRIPCPHCGRRKVNVEAHIMAKHPDLYRAEKPVHTNESKPLYGRSKSSRWKCPHCSRMVSKLYSHIRRAHLREVAECPKCYEMFSNTVAGAINCPSCAHEFTLKKSGALKGAQIQCPHCHGETYAEASGMVVCMRCGGKIKVNKDLSVGKAFAAAVDKAACNTKQPKHRTPRSIESGSPPAVVVSTWKRRRRGGVGRSANPLGTERSSYYRYLNAQRDSLSD